MRPEPDFASFKRHVTTVVDEAVRGDARLVVLPELVTMGLLSSFPDAQALTVAQIASTYRNLFPTLTDRFIQMLSDLAQRHGIWLLGGSHWRCRSDGSYVNTAYLARPDGTVESQDKLHLTPPEVAIGTTPGDDLLVTTIDLIRVAVLICADIQFPEVSRHLVTAENVQLLLCPALTWSNRGVNRVRYACHARAVENEVFVVVSTLVGTCGVPLDSPLHGKGNAFVACPIDRVFGRDDGVLVSATEASEQLAIVDLDFAQLAASRANNEPPGLSNIRPDFYRALGGKVS
jgi:predicted amidohydrolase